MKRSIVFIVIMLMLVNVSYSAIGGRILFGERKHYITTDHEFYVELTGYEGATERVIFNVNGEELKLLPLQKAKVDGVEFIFKNRKMETINQLTVDFEIGIDEPFECKRECIEDSFVNFVRIFNKDFELCKRNCNEGCGLYKETKCIDNSIWTFDSCEKKIEEITKCEKSCKGAACVECGNGICEKGENGFNCPDCKKMEFCISDEDCGKYSCVAGKCQLDTFMEGDGVCSLPDESCESEDCSCDNSDVKEGEKNDYPILIVHGFGSTPSKMKELQRHLIDDLGYADGGEISIFSEECPSDERKAVYLATYYETFAMTQADRAADLMQKSYTRMMGKDLAEGASFADMFEMIVDKVKTCSDTNKVNIISHSMGGLVTLSYVANKDNMKEVAKVIVLGTPNHGGIYGQQTYQLFKGLEASMGDRKDLLRRCSLIEVPSLVMSLVDGRDVTKECQQLQDSGSIESESLSVDETPGLVDYYTIAGDIDGVGDGTVSTESVALSGAVFNKVVDCDHFNLKNPSKCQKGYYYVIAALGYDPFTTVKMNFIDTARDFILSIFN